jgi:hypothetical protein
MAEEDSLSIYFCGDEEDNGKPIYNIGCGVTYTMGEIVAGPG